jgi:hypothetical protein
VFSATFMQNPNPPMDFTSKDFVMKCASNGSFISLATIQCPDDVEINSINTINSSGLIAATGYVASDDYAKVHALLLVPVKTIQVDAFIPQEYVQSPVFGSMTHPLSHTYGGDKRKDPLDGSLTTGTAIFNKSMGFRMQQTVQITDFKMADPDGSKEQSTAKFNMGTSKLYYDSSVVDGHLAAGATPIQTAIATPDTNVVSVTHPSDRKVIVEIGGAASDPLAIGSTTLGPIVYDITVVVDYSNPSNPTYTLSGGHKSFPAYEVYINNQLVHDYSPIPGHYTPSALMGSFNDITSGNITSGTTKQVSGSINP